jgi:uncharacterized protein YbaA (DUF1428 family)
MPYVDGFILAVPKANLERYKDMSYVECLADDVPYGELTSFPRAVQAKEDETVIFSWITYESRARRDEINARVMKDERFSGNEWTQVFDGKRMIFGGFEPFLTL